MMLKDIQLFHFKNYHQFFWDDFQAINCIVGKNGTGKTNLLDAIYYLCIGKSFFSTTEQQNIRHEASELVLRGTFDLHKKEENISCKVQSGKKKLFRRNEIPYKKLSEHIGLLPVVMIAPDDSSILLGHSEDRRKYLDSILTQMDWEYLSALNQYNKALQQRNALLKYFNDHHYFDKIELKSWDQLLIKHGTIIHQKRSALIAQIATPIHTFYKSISGDRERISLLYESNLNEKDMESLLEQSLSKDRILLRTTAGIHRDDLLFLMNNQPSKRFSSQGQQKSFLVALKLAQHQLLKNKKGMAPILLLDDIFDKLDHERVQHLIQIVQELSCQTFLTDTDRERVEQSIPSSLSRTIIDIASITHE